MQRSPVEDAELEDGIHKGKCKGEDDGLTKRVKISDFEVERGYLGLKNSKRKGSSSDRQNKMKLMNLLEPFYAL